MTYVDLPWDQHREVEVLVDGTWWSGFLEAYRKDGERWTGFVRHNRGPGRNYVGWHDQDYIRRPSG